MNWKIITLLSVILLSCYVRFKHIDSFAGTAVAENSVAGKKGSEAGKRPSQFGLGIESLDAQNLAESGDAVILDIRSEESFKRDRIARAISAPLDTLDKSAAASLPTKDKFILIYCQDGAKGQEAAEVLGGLGYTDVHFIIGGLDGWHGPIINEYGNPEYNSIVKSPPDNNTPFSFTTKQAIRPEFPDSEELAFTLDGYTYIEWWGGYKGERWTIGFVRTKVTGITIKKADGALVQHITDLDVDNEHAGSDNRYGLDFMDWNFDGYLDMSLVKYMGGTSGNMPGYYWLWNPSLGQFVMNNQLADMASSAGINKDDSTETILSFAKSGGYIIVTEYKYDDEGRINAISQEEQGYDDDKGSYCDGIRKTNFITGKVESGLCSNSGK